MEHSEAVKMVAAGKYLLGELTPSERESFEDHYFGCAECAAEVKSTALFVDNLREVLGAETAPKQAPVLATEAKPRWSAWLRPAFAVPVFALLLVMVGYQNLVTIPGLKDAAKPQALATFSLMTAGSRSAGESVIEVGKTTPFGIYFDIPAGADFAHYTCAVRNEGNKQFFSIDVPAREARDSVQLLIPGATLDSGRYYLVVLGHRANEGAGATGEEVARLPFAVAIK